VLPGRQSALLVPLIVVAGLHADALRARLPTEVCIEVLTRKTKLETLLHRVEAGAVSVVVGTSALLSPALTFKNLGLLVVDEEQQRRRVAELQRKLAAEKREREAANAAANAAAGSNAWRVGSPNRSMAARTRQLQIVQMPRFTPRRRALRTRVSFTTMSVPGATSSGRSRTTR
jgi:hypothetical protein